MERYTMLWIGKINTVNTIILTKGIYRFSAIPIKILMAFFTEIGQIIIKFVQKMKDPEDPKQS